MKRSILRILLVFMTMCILLGSVACTADTVPEQTTAGESTNKEEETKTEPESKTEEQSETVSETVSETESESESETETEAETNGAFINDVNNNHVKYELVKNTIKLEGYNPDNVGKIMASDEKGVVTLLSSDFEDGDHTIGGKLLYKDASLGAVVDGKLAYKYSNGEFSVSGHSVMSPDLSMASNDYLQTQLSMDLRSFRHEQQNDCNPWIATIIGCYTISNFAQCTDPANGIWFAFVPEKYITIYAGDASSWPTGVTKVPLPKGFGDEEVHIDFVCTEDRSVYLYAKYNGEENTVLLCRTEAKDGKINIYDGSEQLLASVNGNISTLNGTKFTVFSHMANCTIDNLNIYAAQKNIERTEQEVIATPEEGYSLGLDITDKTGLVSICYSVWFTGIIGEGTAPVESFNNMTLAVEGKQPWGGSPAFHYWAKPAQGYYRSTDKQATYNNLKLIGEAGVDFIILDFTNYGDGYVTNEALGEAWAWAPTRVLCETLMEMRAQGITVPYVVFWCPNAELVVNKIYNDFIQNEKWADCFVYWEGKPFICVTGLATDFPANYKSLFTVRRMWGLTTQRCWRFLNVNNRGTVYAKNEQLSVAVASQETYMSAPTAHGRNHGIFFYEQWCEAFKVRPKVVTVTWWNEWCAQRLYVDGEYVFTDAYLAEYSRDIEPMEGGHGDQYYQWLKKYVSDYKAGVEECPRLVEEGY